jgi:hypothetical protein
VLIVDGSTWLLVAAVGVIVAACIIALLTRDAPGGEAMTPFSLSEDERLSLEAMALRIRKKALQDRKAQREGRRGVTPGGPVSAGPDG